MRGICYSPVPVGEDPGYHAPFGDYFTSQYSGLFERDLALMAEMGANTIRMYTFSTSLRHTQFLDAALAHGLSVVAVFEMGGAEDTTLQPASSLAIVQTRLQVPAGMHGLTFTWRSRALACTLSGDSYTRRSSRCM